jgi:hypothetical protein
MIVLPITLLAYEGPIARAYLTVLQNGGYRFRSIRSLILRPARKRSWLPQAVMDVYRERRALDTHLYWPRWLRQCCDYLYREMITKVGAAFALREELFDEALEGRDFSHYCDDVRTVSADGFNDPGLSSALADLDPGEILFTGGGIVPAALLSDSARPWLHVHPGFLPHVRGADGVLWSALVRHRAGASCFHMAAGIDLGPVLAAREFDLPLFSLPKSHRPDDAMLYRALFSFYDPYLRASLLLDHLCSRKERQGWTAPKPVPQNPNAGVTYHFMHPLLRQRALGMLFREI